MASKLQPDQSEDLLYFKKGNVFCGYKREYLAQNLSSMEEGFVVCKKCSGIMREPSICNGETTCLVCSVAPDKLSPVKAVQDSIGMLQVKCPLLRDCAWKGELSGAETHVKHCLRFVVECKKCGQVFLRGEKDDHERHSCPLRNVKCNFCSKNGKAGDEEKHLKFCCNFPITCSNGCGAKFPRVQLSKHKSECELETVACPYREYGCGVKSMLRKELLAHKKEFYIEHQDMSLVEIFQLRKENKELKWKVKTMRELDGVEWDIKDIDKLKLDMEVEGPTFYVNNYKLRIYAIRRGSLVIRNIYFYFKRTQGEYDFNLRDAYITHYKRIIVNKQDFNQSDYQEGGMKHQLIVQSKSEMFPYTLSRRRSSTEVQSLFVRFYFNVNTKPLESLDVRCSKEIIHLQRKTGTTTTTTGRNKRGLEHFKKTLQSRRPTSIMGDKQAETDNLLLDVSHFKKWRAGSCVI